MKSTHILFLLSSLLFFSCANEEKEQKTYLSDVTIENEQISCDGIILENYTGVIDKDAFSYGEKVTLYYDNMTGFETKDSLVYPDMDIFVLSKKGDTVLVQKELLKNSTVGYSELNLLLSSKFTFAKPMLAGNSYQMNVQIRDKNNDDAYFNLKKDFKLVENPLLKTEINNMTYDVFYLFSQNRNLAIVDNKISPEEEIYIIVENLEGYEVDENGLVDIQASISLVGADGFTVLENKNMFSAPVNARDLKDQVYANFSVTKGYVKNPVTCTFLLKDRKSGHSFKTTFDVIIEENVNEEK